jgi:hypothetical protein
MGENKVQHALTHLGILALLHLEASRNEVILRPWLGYGCPNLGVRIERCADAPTPISLIGLQG